MENFIEVVNKVDRCRMFVSFKEAVIFNDINLFNRYSTRGAGSIKVLLCKYEYDTRKKLNEFDIEAKTSGGAVFELGVKLLNTIKQ